MPIFRRENGKLEAVPGNYAILDDYGKMPIETLPIEFLTSEHYENHNGDVNNFLETAVTGIGTATEDTTNHKMYLHNPNGGGLGSALYRTKKQYIPDSEILTASFLIDDLVVGTGGSGLHLIGLSDALPALSTGGYCFTLWSYGGTMGWWILVYNNTSNNLTASPVDPVAGDIVSFVISKTTSKAFINNVEIYSSAIIPAGLMNAGVSVAHYAGVIDHDISIDYMSVNKI